MVQLTSDDHTCVLLLDDITLRQVLGATDPDDVDVILRLNLAATAPGWAHRRLIGAPATVAARHAKAHNAPRHARQDHETAADAGVDSEATAA